MDQLSGPHEEYAQGLVLLTIMTLMGRDLNNITPHEKAFVTRAIQNVELFLNYENVRAQEEFASLCAQKGITVEEGRRAIDIVQRRLVSTLGSLTDAFANVIHN